VAHKLVLVYELNPGINPKGCAAAPSCVQFRSIQNILFPDNFRYPGNIFASVANQATAANSNSNYNSLQVSVNKHMSQGLQCLAAYTYGHSLDNSSSFEGKGRQPDPFNRHLDYGDSDYDARQRLVVSYIYNFPSARHIRAFKKIPSRLTGGWRIAGITTFQTGFPITLYESGFRSLTCVASSFFGCSDRPDVIGPVRIPDPRTSSIVNTVNSPDNRTAQDHYAILTPIASCGWKVLEHWATQAVTFSMGRG
jgi:hypothetical protein